MDSVGGGVRSEASNPGPDGRGDRTPVLALSALWWIPCLWIGIDGEFPLADGQPKDGPRRERESAP